MNRPSPFGGLWSGGGRCVRASRGDAGGGIFTLHWQALLSARPDGGWSGRCQGMGDLVCVACSSARQGSAYRGTSQKDGAQASWWLSVPPLGGIVMVKNSGPKSKRPRFQPVPAFPGEMALTSLAWDFPSVR